jgi:hypothetical protein
MKWLLWVWMFCSPSIFDYRTQLQLSSAQIKEMRRLLDDLVKDQEAALRQEAELEKKYRQLISQQPPEAEVIDLLGRIEAARTARRLADFRASQRILQQLSPEQLKRWRELQSSSQK